MEFVPAVYEHAAALIGRTPWEVSRDENLFVEAHAAAYRRYGHRPVVVGIDIYNLEAEALGGRIDPPEGRGIPAISRPPCDGLDAVNGLPVEELPSLGRIPMMIRAARRLADRFPEADVRVPVSGPFSLLGALAGLESAVVRCALAPESVREALRQLRLGLKAFIAAACEAGVGVTIFESDRKSVV